MEGIFISYRRDDSAGYAGRLYDRLIPRFGARRVFMDVEGIELGADFVTAIEEAVGSCRVLIVIVGDEWLTIQDAAGRRRLDDPHDFIRLETATALKRGIRVVPVLVGGALMPRAEELPDELRPLARRQAIEISHKQWDATTDELIRALEGMLSDSPTIEPAPRPDSLPAPLAAPVHQELPRRPWRAAVVAGVALFAVAAAWWMLQRGREEPDTSTQATMETLMTAQVKPEGGGAPVAAAVPVAPPPATVVAAATPPPVAAAAPVVVTRPAATAARVPPPSTTVASPPVTRPLAPAPAPSAPPRPVAAAVPATTAAPEAPRVVDAGTPRVGESWTYRTSGKWPTSPRRTIVIEVQAVNNGVVTDGLRAEGLAADARRSSGAQPTFMSWNEIGNEFSPYLAAYSDIASLGTLRGFATPDVAPNWSQWYSEAKVIGQEAVTVPAGSFQAHKIEVWSSRHATGGPIQASIEPVRIHYLIWYAAPAKRYVKMQRRVLSASGAENERDVFELAAHR